MVYLVLICINIIPQTIPSINLSILYDIRIIKCMIKAHLNFRCRKYLS